MSKLRNWLPSFAIAMIIFILSSVPGDTIDSAGLGNNTLHINGHFFLYVLLTVSLFRGIKNIPGAITVSILYGIFDEFHQYFTPDRSSSILDLFVDTIGSIIGGLILWKRSLLPRALKDWLEE